MGCDIHPHIEIKIKGKWHHYSIPLLDRNYRLFTRICGVRQYDDDIKPIDSPRGLPPDVSEVTQLCYDWEAGGHSATWLSAKELNDLIKWHEELIEEHSPGHGYTAQHRQWGYLNGNNFLEYKESHPSEIEDCRFICWFDN